MLGFARVVGYFVAMAVVDIAVDYWEVRRMEREFNRYSNDNDGEVSAHVVTEDTAGAVMTVGGTSRDVGPGDVLIATDRPDVFHVHGSDGLNDYQQVDSDSLDTLVTEDADAPDDDQDNDEFDPSEVSAAEVRAYLDQQRQANNRAEYDRVANAERAGRNRSSALVPFER